VEAFETGGTEKTGFFTRQGIIHCHPSEISSEKKTTGFSQDIFA